MLRKSFFIKHMKTHKCRVKAAKWFPEAAIYPKLANNDELPTVEPTSHTVNDRVVKEPESEGKTTKFIDELNDFTKANDYIPLDSEPKIKITASSLVSCHLCGTLMLKKNVKRHSVTAHNSISTTAVCCDQVRGLYMVRKNQKGGIGYPVHVQKGIHCSKSTSADCGDLKCTLEMHIASRAKMTGRECRHLLQVNNASFPDRTILIDARSSEVGQENRYKLLNSETSMKCIELNKQAMQINAPAVVQWQDGKYVHMSVIDDNKNSRPVQMRCIVSFNKQNGRIDCQCNRQRYFCIHRAMGLWFLYQTNQLLSSIKEEANEDTELGDLSSDEECNAPEPQTRMIFGDLIYPPQDSSTLYKMYNYLITKKQIPVDIPYNLTTISIDSIPKAFIPIDN